MEQDVDARMRRTAIRPLPVGRKSVFHATTIGLLAALGGSLYLAALLSLMGMTGRLYPMGTVILGLALLYFGVRLPFLGLPLSTPVSKMRARHVLQATVIYCAFSLP
jgi:heme O synthase-like polyprenyltransferase